MKTTLSFLFLFLILCFMSLTLLSQTQVGSDIEGEAANDFSGASVAISSTGTRVAIGAGQNDGNGSNSGHVRIYEESGGNWIQLGSDIDGEGIGDGSGLSVSISSDGKKVAIGARWNDGNGTDSGHARIYEESAGNWTQVGNDIDGEAASDNSGYSVSLSPDGTRVAIGATENDGNGANSGHVRIYEESAGNWTQVGNDIDGEAAGDQSGHFVSLSSDGTRVAIGARFNDGNGDASGHVRIYEESAGNWTQVGNDIDGEAESDNFGQSVSLSPDGTRVAIGAEWNNGNGSESGHVRIYEESAGNWTQVGNDIDGEAAGDRSGYSVSLSSDGTIVAIGAIGNGPFSGHVRIYKESGGNWIQVGSDIDGEAAGDASGVSVSLSSDGSKVAIGATGNDGNGTDAGHVRVFKDLLLPVELFSFKGRKYKGNFVLVWQTASEQNNQGFQIQKSTNGKSWKDIDFVKGFGNSTVLQTYEYIDRNPFIGTNYYRLKQIDFDGGFDYSKIVSVDFRNNNLIQVYPNPTSGNLEIIGLEFENAKIKILDNTGKLIQTKVLNHNSIDISDLPQGVYFLSLANGIQTFQQKIIKN